MVLRRPWRPAAAGALLVICTGGVSAQGGGALAALAGLERGQWQLNASGGGAPERLCLANPSALLQLRHRGVQCSQFVMENTPQRAMVRYTCPGRGHGRTIVTVETPRLVRVETQGLVDGAPFDEEYEGRRVGACS